MLVGMYTSDTNVNVSKHGAESADEFIAACKDSYTQYSWDNSYRSPDWGGRYVGLSDSYVAPSLSLNGNTLQINIGRLVAI